jgi:D-psicose/D-tagatose/L-ribulose 3-epimerase
MKYGFNMLLWTGHVTQEHVPLFKALKKAGYDGVEFPLFEGTPDHYARLGEQLDKLGLERSTVSVLGRGSQSAFARQGSAGGGPGAGQMGC